MVAQLRIYQIKPGTMDAWLELFREKVVPLHRKYGIPVHEAWVNVERSEFVWFREFESAETIEEQQQRYVTADERIRVLGDEPKQYIEGMEVRVVERVYGAT